MTDLKFQDNTPARTAFFVEIRKLVNAHMDNMSPVEMLAIFASTMGSFIAASHIDLDDDKLAELIYRNMSEGYRVMKEHIALHSGEYR